jgi:Fe2+ transport system protein FeoA
MEHKKQVIEKIFRLADIAKKFEIEQQNIFKIDLIIGGNSVRERLFNIGIKENSLVKILHSRINGPCIVLVNDVKLIIGAEMTRRIFVEPVFTDI